MFRRKYFVDDRPPKISKRIKRMSTEELDKYIAKLEAKEQKKREKRQRREEKKQSRNKR